MKQYLVAYDIADPKRLNRVRKIAYSYALSGQKSAVEAPLEAATMRELLSRLSREIDPETDRVHIIPYKGEPLLFGRADHIGMEEGVLIL
jgi:CRISPR-associated protein Cas2